MAASKRRTSTAKAAKPSPVPAGPKPRAQTKPSSLRHQLPTPDDSQSPDLGDSEADGAGPTRKSRGAAKESGAVSKLPVRIHDRIPALSEKAKGKRPEVLHDAGDVFTASCQKASMNIPASSKGRTTRIPALQSRKVQNLVASTSRAVATSTPRSTIAQTSSAIRQRTTSVVPERVYSAVRPVPLKNVVHTSPPRSKIVYSDSDDSDSDTEFLLKSHSFNNSHRGRGRTVAGEFEWDERSRSCVPKRECSRSRSLAFTAKGKERSHAWPDATMLSSAASPEPLDHGNVLDGLHDARHDNEEKPRSAFSMSHPPDLDHSLDQSMNRSILEANDGDRVEGPDEDLNEMVFDFTNHDAADEVSSSGHVSDEERAWPGSVQPAPLPKMPPIPILEDTQVDDMRVAGPVPLGEAADTVSAVPVPLMTKAASKVSTPPPSSPRRTEVLSPAKSASPRKRKRSDYGPSLQSLAYEAILGRLRAPPASPKQKEVQEYAGLLQEPAPPKEEQISPVIPADEQMVGPVAEPEPVKAVTRSMSPLPPSSPPPVTSEVRSILEETDSDESDMDTSHLLKRSTTTPSESGRCTVDHKGESVIADSPPDAADDCELAPAVVITKDSPRDAESLSSPRYLPVKDVGSDTRPRSLTPQLPPSPLAQRARSPSRVHLSPQMNRACDMSHSDVATSLASATVAAAVRLSPALALSARLRTRSPSVPLHAVQPLLDAPGDIDQLSPTRRDRSPMSAIRSANRAKTRSVSPLKPTSVLIDIGTMPATPTRVSPIHEQSMTPAPSALPISISTRAQTTPLLARIQAYKRSIASRSPGPAPQVKEESPAHEAVPGNHVEVDTLETVIEEPSEALQRVLTVPTLSPVSALQPALTAPHSTLIVESSRRRRSRSSSSSSSLSIDSNAATPYKSSAAKSLSFAEIGGMDSSPLSVAASVGRSSFRALHSSSDESEGEEQASPSRTRSQASAKNVYRSMMSMSPTASAARTSTPYRRAPLQSVSSASKPQQPALSPAAPLYQPLKRHGSPDPEGQAAERPTSAAPQVDRMLPIDAQNTVTGRLSLADPRQSPDTPAPVTLTSNNAAVCSAQAHNNQCDAINEPLAGMTGDDSFVGPERPTLLTEVDISMNESSVTPDTLEYAPADESLSQSLDRARPRSELIAPPLPVRTRSKQRASVRAVSVRNAVSAEAEPTTTVASESQETSRQTRSPSVVSVAHSNVSNKSAQVQVSSTDPHAAARAAAILKVHGQYINGGPVPSQSAQPAAGYLSDGERLLDELLREAELEISMQAVRDSSEQPQDVHESSDRVEPDEDPAQADEANEPAANTSIRRLAFLPPHERCSMWTRHNWRALEQCFIDEHRRCSRRYVGVDIAEVVRQFLESENVKQSQCQEEWAVEKIEARIEALVQRKAQRHAIQESQRRRERSVSFVSSVHSRAPSEFFELADASTLVNIGDMEDTVRLPAPRMLSPSSALRPVKHARAFPPPQRRAESVFSAASEPVLYSRQSSETTMSKIKKMYPSLDELELEVRRPRRNMSIRGRSIKAAVQMFERIEEEQSKDVLRAHLGKRKYSESADDHGQAVKRQRM